MPEEVETSGWHGRLGTARFQFRYYRTFARAYRRLSRVERPDFVFIPYLDYCAYAVSVLGSPFGRTPWGGIMMKSHFHLEEMGVQVPSSRLRWIGGRLFLRILRNRSLRALFTFDETLVHYVRKRHPGLSRVAALSPRAHRLRGSHSRGSARQFLGIPGDATVILVYGALDASKGIDALLDGTRMDGFPEDISLLVAGLQAPGVKALLASPLGQGDARGRAGQRVRRLSVRRRRAGGVPRIRYGLDGLPGTVHRERGTAPGGPGRIASVACEEGLIGWLTPEVRVGPRLTVNIGDPRMVAGGGFKAGER